MMTDRTQSTRRSIARVFTIGVIFALMLMASGVAARPQQQSLPPVIGFRLDAEDFARHQAALAGRGLDAELAALAEQYRVNLLRVDEAADTVRAFLGLQMRAKTSAPREGGIDLAELETPRHRLQAYWLHVGDALWSLERQYFASLDKLVPDEHELIGNLRMATTRRHLLPRNGTFNGANVDLSELIPETEGDDKAVRNLLNDYATDIDVLLRETDRARRERYRLRIDEPDSREELAERITRERRVEARVLVLNSQYAERLQAALPQNASLAFADAWSRARFPSLWKDAAVQLLAVHVNTLPREAQAAYTETRRSVLDLLRAATKQLSEPQLACADEKKIIQAYRQADAEGNRSRMFAILFAEFNEIYPRADALANRADELAKAFLEAHR